MTKMTVRLFAFFATLPLILPLAYSAPALAGHDDPSQTLVMETSKGTIRIRLMHDFAPKHAERLKTLSQEKFYDGVVFHRVLAGFMAQTGDPTGTGTGGSSYPDLKAEFSAVPFERGTLGMARSQSPNSANSQFFIVYARSDWLDGKYTVVGQVIEGMDVADALKKGDRAKNGMVDNPDRIVRMRLASDTQ
jgi:peptidylprolyl isomerase